MRKRFQDSGDTARAINEAFEAARRIGETQEQLLARLQIIRDELNSKTPGGAWRYDQYMRAHAQGYIQARHDDVMRKYVEFCYRDAAGVLYSTHRDSTHRKTEEFHASGRGAELSTLEGTHVWKGTDKPFGPWTRYGSEPHTVS